MVRPALLLTFVLPWIALAQRDGGVRDTPSAPGLDRCGRANWVCVSECIDVRCIQRCLEKGCDQRLRELRECTQAKQCPGEDPRCAREQCGPLCAAAFAQTQEPVAHRKEDPCAGLPAAKVQVPRELVGGWNLEAASMPVETSATAPSPEPRPDYEKVLTVNDRGCFVLETKLEDTTLGQGNLLVVRSWGTVEVKTGAKRKDRTLRFQTADAQAVGHLCSKERTLELKAEHFVQPEYRLEVEDEVLTLTSTQPDKQTFQFKKGEPQKLRDEK